MDKEDILSRLSPHSVGILKKLNPKLVDMKSVPVSEIVSLISKESKGIGDVMKDLKISGRLRKQIIISDWIIDAYHEAYISDSRTIEVQHLAFALLLRIDKEKYYRAKKMIPRASEKSVNEILGRYVEDYTELAKTGKITSMIGRTKELTHLIVNLSTVSGKPTLLLGEAGSGKTSLMLELARHIVEGNVPAELLNSRVLRIKLSNLISALPIENGLLPNGFLSNLFSSIAEVNKDLYQKTILFFDDLNYGVNFFVGVESANAGGDILFVGAARDDNNEKFWDSPVSRMWNIVFIDDQDDGEVKKILTRHGFYILSKHGVGFTDEAISKVMDMKRSELTSDSMPGGGMKIMDLLCTYKRHITAGYKDQIRNVSSAEVMVTDQDVEIFLEGTHLDKDAVSTTKLLNLKLIDLEDKIKKEIIGQDIAIGTLVSALRVSSLKFQTVSRPVGTFLFLGPTGVGKTQTAKSLAKNLFGYRVGSKQHPDKFIRIDMTEFSEKHSVSKLFGAPPGYIGYDDQSSLCDFVSENPSCIVLFDEIDKAHPEVLNSLLHIMDEGEIRNNSGDLVSFEEVIILMTSNHGAELINKSRMGFYRGSPFKKGCPSWQKELKAYVKKQMKPEFLNRFDEMIIFDILAEASLMQISENMINPVISNLLAKGVKLKVTYPVKKYLVRKSGNEYGARELRRIINRELVDPISKILFENNDVKEIKTSVARDGVKISAQ